jgi:peptidyl-prolyl cis-trans isomerase SurA
MKAPGYVVSGVLLVALAAGAQKPSLSTTRLPQPGPTRAVAPEKPVARVNGAVLTDHDLLREMLNEFPYARMHRGFPKDSEAEIRKNALHEIEFEELVYQEAKRRKMSISKSRLDRAIADFKKQFDSDEEFQNYLALELKGSLPQLREKVQRAILIDDLLKLEVGNKARVTPAEVRAFYKANLEHFRRPESVSLQTISLAIPENATPQQRATIRQRAEEALKQARATKDYESFGLLAEKISEDDWRVMMGDHKSLHRGRMPAPVEKVVFAMKVNEIGDIIDTGDSFCIARVYRHEDAKLIPFEQVRKDLTRQVRQQKTDALRGTLDARLRKGAKIEEL